MGINFVFTDDVWNNFMFDASGDANAANVPIVICWSIDRVAKKKSVFDSLIYDKVRVHAPGAPVRIILLLLLIHDRFLVSIDK